jgi:prepilin-type N-terminal cleavage/methylation domain-containing protein
MQIQISRKSGFTLVEIMIVVAIIGLLAAIAIPNFVKARETAQLNSIVNNLRITEGAKDQWALENKKGTGDVPVDTDLAPYMKNNTFPPSLIVGETYNILAVGTSSNAKTPVKLGTYAVNSNVTIP